MSSLITSEILLSKSIKDDTKNDIKDITKDDIIEDNIKDCP